MFPRLQQQIVRAVRAGVELDEIEQLLIDPAPLDEEQKAALWLYAEGLTQRHSESMSIAESLAPLGS